jgi:hypothetical protein
MTQKMNSKVLEWLEKEKVKDKIELDLQKKQIIESIRILTKDDILPKPPEKLSLWKRIKKVLMG